MYTIRYYKATPGLIYEVTIIPHPLSANVFFFFLFMIRLVSCLYLRENIFNDISFTANFLQYLGLNEIPLRDLLYGQGTCTCKWIYIEWLFEQCVFATCNMKLAYPPPGNSGLINSKTLLKYSNIITSCSCVHTTYIYRPFGSCIYIHML